MRGISSDQEMLLQYVVRYICTCIWVGYSLLFLFSLFLWHVDAYLLDNHVYNTDFFLIFICPCIVSFLLILFTVSVSD
jgi:hypothetical protein